MIDAALKFVPEKVSANLRQLAGAESCVVTLRQDAQFIVSLSKA